MSVHLNCNLKSLINHWPYGAVRTLAALKTQGLYRQLAHKYVTGGWLRHYGYGAYVRAGDPVDWLGGVYGLQEAGLELHVGGRTALALQGAAHFIAMSNETLVQLYTQNLLQLPPWFMQQEWNVKVQLFKSKLFSEVLGLVAYPYQGFSINISSPERAIIESLALVSDEQSFEDANYLIEGLGSLRPQLLQNLLEKCTSIKIKRIFLFLAKHNEHLWFKELNQNKITLGSGSRSIIKGGKYDPTYLITVPHSFSTLKIDDIP